MSHPFVESGVAVVGSSIDIIMFFISYFYLAI